MDIPVTFVETSHGKLALRDTASPESPLPTLFLAPANSCSGRFFYQQWGDSSLTKKYRIVALDLPGHGDSARAIQPERSYSFPGYGEAIAEAVQKLVKGRCVLVGWSLGGHGVLEALDKLDGNCCGALITGTPPIELSGEGVGKGFRKAELDLMKYVGQEHLSRDELKLFMSGTGYDGSQKREWILEEAAKTDGLARKLMIQSVMEGRGQDEVRLVARTTLPLAVVGGKNEPVINYDYVEGLKFGNLWEGKVHLIEGAGHAVMIEKAPEFNALLDRFAEDCFS